MSTEIEDLQSQLHNTEIALCTLASYLSDLLRNDESERFDSIMDAYYDAQRTFNPNDMPVFITKED